MRADPSASSVTPPLTSPCVWQETTGAREGDRVAAGAAGVIAGYLGGLASALPRRNAGTTVVRTTIS